MIRLLLVRLALAVALGAGAMGILGRAEPAQPLPLIKADFPLCVTIRPGPLAPPKPRLTGNTPQSEIS